MIMHPVGDIILIALFFGSFIGACAGIGRTTKPPAPDETPHEEPP